MLKPTTLRKATVILILEEFFLLNKFFILVQVCKVYKQIFIWTRFEDIDMPHYTAVGKLIDQ